MLQCWQDVPDRRPTFKVIESQISMFELGVGVHTSDENAANDEEDEEIRL